MTPFSLAFLALSLASAANAQWVSVSTYNPPPYLQGDASHCPGHYITGWTEGCKSSKCFSYSAGINCAMMFHSNKNADVTNCKFYQNSDCSGFYVEYKGKWNKDVQVKDLNNVYSMQCWNGC